MKSPEQVCFEKVLSVLNPDAALQDMIKLRRLDQSGLRQHGYTKGGPTPYGYERWIVNRLGVPTMSLAPKEKVKSKDYHVACFPTNKAELDIVRKILRLSKVMTLNEIAIVLSQTKIPPPRGATQNGWSSSAVKRIIAHFTHHPEAFQISDVH